MQHIPVDIRRSNHRTVVMTKPGLVRWDEFLPCSLNGLERSLTYSCPDIGLCATSIELHKVNSIQGNDYSRREHRRRCVSPSMSLEPVKVFQDLTNKIAATKVHFEEYSAGVSKLLKLKV